MRTSKPLTAFVASPARKTLNQFSSDLQIALNNAIEENVPKRTCVIALHWENDDMGVVPLENELLHVFNTMYGFETESFTIPLVNSELDLAQHLLEWSRARPGKETLRILVYSGHASAAGTEATQWRLAGKSDRHGRIQGPSLNWWGIRYLFELVDGQVCHIFDCCSGGSGALSSYQGAELMAASAWEQSATSSIHFSLTRVLIDELRDANGQPQTLANIYAKIFRFAQQNQVGAAPIHIPKIGSPSVTIGRVQSVSLQPGPITRSRSRQRHRVLLSVQLEENSLPDPRQWAQWLTQNIPPGVLAADVTIESVYRGSTLLLFSVPVEVWTMLPSNDQSYQFIDHVTSRNLLSPGLAPLELPIRLASPLSGRENQPPRSPERKSPGRGGQ